MRYIDAFWPGNATGALGSDIRGYLEASMNDYSRCVQMATHIARLWTERERPKASQKYIDRNAPKFAQEQARMFVPVIFPTGLDYTVNLVTLAALYRAAWSPVMRQVTQQMVDAVVAQFPEISFMFDVAKRRIDDWAPLVQSPKFTEMHCKPRVELTSVRADAFLPPQKSAMHPLDLLHYMPERMENSVDGVEATIEVSVATMGQDQRHRTIRRGMPSFTGAFYMPPLIARGMGFAGSLSLAANAMERWLALAGRVPRSLATVLAPYGAMVTYRKAGSFNAVAHEQAKRLCWCAQEEIYHLSHALREEVLKGELHDSRIAQLFDPPCRSTGVCGEGPRYCGRDLRAAEHFPKRVV